MAISCQNPFSAALLDSERLTFLGSSSTGENEPT